MILLAVFVGLLGYAFLRLMTGGGDTHGCAFHRGCGSNGVFGAGGGGGVHLEALAFAPKEEEPEGLTSGSNPVSVPGGPYSFGHCTLYSSTVQAALATGRGCLLIDRGRFWCQLCMQS